MLFSRKCELCKAEAKKPVERKVPVYGYTEEQKRHFCSKEHADVYERNIRELMKTYKPSSRACFGC